MYATAECRWGNYAIYPSLLDEKIKGIHRKFSMFGSSHNDLVDMVLELGTIYLIRIYFS